MPITLERCGGGSFACALDVRLERDSAVAGAEVSRSVYEMNDRRLVVFFGEGGACVALEVEVGEGSVCRGCSACVAVVGEESSECTEK